MDNAKFLRNCETFKYLLTLILIMLEVSLISKEDIISINKEITNITHNVLNFSSLDYIENKMIYLKRRFRNKKKS